MDTICEEIKKDMKNIEQDSKKYIFMLYLIYLYIHLNVG